MQQTEVWRRSLVRLSKVFGKTGYFRVTLLECSCLRAYVEGSGCASVHVGRGQVAGLQSGSSQGVGANA
eukprot:8055579-Alexandrium_andersonii.AAC.1